VRTTTLKLRRTLFEWVDSNEFPWLWPRPWNLTESEWSIRILRLHATRILRRKKVAQQGWLRTLSQAAVWPFISLIKISLDIRQTHAGTTSIKETVQLFADKWTMLFWHHFRLSDQTDICLELLTNRQRIRSFMPCRELQVINTLSQQHGPGWPEIERKLSFARFCQTHHLPAPDTLAASDPAIVNVSAWPLCDLFLKPANQGKGRGMEILRYQPSARTWRNKVGDLITPQNLAIYASKKYAGGPWLLQPHIRNDRAWSKYTSDALCTARIVTGLRPGEAEPVFISGFVRFPFPGAVIDNLSAGGIGAGVLDPAGTMTPGFVWVGQTGTYHTHPVSGARIAGEILPHWPELVALALNAHRAAHGWTTVGWDVTYSEDGPLLIEANLNWAVLFHEPLTDTPFISILQSLYGPRLENLPSSDTPST
jgi:hypothetical protein